MNIFCIPENTIHAMKLFIIPLNERANPCKGVNSRCTIRSIQRQFFLDLSFGKEKERGILCCQVDIDEDSRDPRGRGEVKGWMAVQTFLSPFRIVLSRVCNYQAGLLLGAQQHCRVEGGNKKRATINSQRREINVGLVFFLSPRTIIFIERCAPKKNEERQIDGIGRGGRIYLFRRKENLEKICGESRLE